MLRARGTSADDIARSNERQLDASRCDPAVVWARHAAPATSGTRTPLFFGWLWPRVRAAVTIRRSERLATNPGTHPQGENQRGSTRPAIRIIRTHARRDGGVRTRAAS